MLFVADWCLIIYHIYVFSPTGNNLSTCDSGIHSIVSQDLEDHSKYYPLSVWIIQREGAGWLVASGSCRSPLTIDIIPLTWVTWLTRRVPLVEQELLTLPEFTFGFCGNRVVKSVISVYCCLFVCLFVLLFSLFFFFFFLPLFVLLSFFFWSFYCLSFWFTVSAYPFCFFNLFFLLAILSTWSANVSRQLSVVTIWNSLNLTGISSPISFIIVTIYLENHWAWLYSQMTNNSYPSNNYVTMQRRSSWSDSARGPNFGNELDSWEGGSILTSKQKHFGFQAYPWLTEQYFVIVTTMCIIFYHKRLGKFNVCACVFGDTSVLKW